MNRRNGLDYFLNKVKEIHNNKFDYSLVTEYKTSRTHVNVICKEHGSFSITPHHHINRKQGCPECKKLGLNGFLIKANKVHDNKYDYSKVIYTNNKAKVDVICPKHGVFNQRVTDHIFGGHGCPECTYETIRKSTEEFINQSILIHNNKYNYSNVGEFKTNKDKVKIICPKHGVFKQKVLCHTQGQGCPICKETSGEQQIRSFLEKQYINFVAQHKFNDCRNIKQLSFDFYLPNHNVCIEYQGKQHYIPINFFGGEKAFKGQQKRDKIKREYCLNNNISLLEIKYNEDINEKLLNWISIIT